MSRRRRNVERHAGDFVYENLSSTVHSMMENRHRLLAPFPLDPMAIYPFFWTAEERKALDTLKGHPELIRNWKSVILHQHFDGKKSDKIVLAKIGISLPEEMPKVRGALDARELPEEMQEKLREWVPYWMSLRNDTKKLVAKIKDTACVCKTYGQVARLWPDLEGFFPQWGRSKVANAKVRSAYPERALEWSRNPETGEHECELQDKFKPESFVPFAEMIAECLMLPNTPGGHTATVELMYV